MNNVQLAKIYAALVGALGILGLFVSGHLFAVTNSDWLLDLVRLALAAYLLYAVYGAKTDSAVNNALLVTGILYIGLAVIGLVSPTLGGLLPSGLTGFDVAFHLITGALATYAGARHGLTRHTTTHA
jgi:hypothetical protein